MSHEIRVPSTGNAGDEAVVLQITDTLGARVSEGEVVALLETAKATFEVESPVAGVVLAVNSKVGDELPEHSVLLVIGDEAEAVAETSDNKLDPADQNLPNVDLAEEINQPIETASAISIDNGPVVPGRANLAEQAISPRARALAEASGVDLASLSGTGPNSRVIARDVSQGSSREIFGQQKSIETSQATITRYAVADALVSLETRLAIEQSRPGESAIGFEDLVNFAVIRALTDSDTARVLIARSMQSSNRSFAVAITSHSESTTKTSLVNKANEVSLEQLAASLKSGSINQAEGIFSISHLGSLGVHWFTPTVNSPQVCVLGVGAIHRPTSDSQALVPLSLAYNPGVIDQAAAARGLLAIGHAIENIDLIGLISLNKN